ncbi:MAG TPA: hypothetical protein VGM68_07590 [Rhizomicrobium sp.]|jgi:hypothetical protein
MFARLSAKAVLLAAGVALVFFGVGLIGLGIAAALAPFVGVAWGNAITGAIFLLPPLIWAIAIISIRPPRRETSAGSSQIMAAIMAAVAKETPWITVVGAGLAGAANMFLNRNKPRK